MNKKILSGSFWMSVGSILSRVLGVVYLIPWLIMLGSYKNQLSAQAIFNASYTPYGLFLTIGTAGLPSVIAREVARLNSQNRYKDSNHLTKMGLALMAVMGVICAIVLYAIAPLIAKSSPVNLKAGTISIRMLTPAVAVLPAMSMIRGWYQGNNDMKPYGMSQLWEQFCRVIFILLATYIVIKVFHMNYVVAVYFSVFAAFIGALASYLYLFIYGLRHLKDYREKTKNSLPRSSEKITDTLVKLWVASLPFILLGSIVTATQLVDQMFFKQILLKFTSLTESRISYLYTVFSANPSKITTVIVSLATSVSETSLPLLAGVMAQKGKSAVQDLLGQNYRLLAFVLFPLVTIASVASGPIYTVLFSQDAVGSFYLMENIWQSLLLALAMNGLTILLALHDNKPAVIYMVIGFLAKLILQLPLTVWMNASGAILATNIAFMLIVILTYARLQKNYSVDLSLVLKIAIITALFDIIIFGINKLLLLFMPVSSRLNSFIYLVVIGILGAGIYLLLTKVTGILKQIF